MKQLRDFHRPIATMMMALLTFWQISQPLQAATILWDADTGTTSVQDGTGTWTGAGTTWWNPATQANVAISLTDIGLFGAGGMGGEVSLSGSQSVAGLIFGQTTTTGYSLTSGAAETLTLGASGISVLPGALEVTIGDGNLSLLLGSTQTWTNRSNGVLTIGGAIDNGGNTLTLTGFPGLPGTGLFSLQAALTGAGGLTTSGLAATTVMAASGFTGATLINSGSSVILSGAAGALSSTSSISLANGTLSLINAVGEHPVDRVANAAGITSYGGTINWTNPNGDTTANWAETLGVLSLQKGQTNIVSTNAVGVGFTQVLTLDAGSLTHAAGNTSTIAFGGTSLGVAVNINNIQITGEATTAANQIIGPWATFGASAASQTDYASFNRTGGTANTRGIQGAGIAASAQTTWTTAANSYTMSAAQTLSATRTINAIRNSGAALTLGLGTSNFNLATYGILNGGTGTLTISNGTGGTGGVTTPTGGDNTLFLIGGNSAISITAPIINNGTAVNVVKAGNSNVTLAGANTYTGVTTVNSGILVSGTSVAANFNGGLASSWLGASSATAPNLILDGGTLRYAGPTAGTTDRLFTLGEAGGTIENSAASNGTLVFTGTGSIVAAGIGDRTLTLNANGTGGFTFTPIIVNPTSGTTALVINSTNSGNIILNPSANNTFTGGITIQARTLQALSANSLGSNVIRFGTGTSPILDLRNNTGTDFGANGATIDLGNNNGRINLSRTSGGNGVTHTLGAVSIGTATLTIGHGANHNTNQASSLILGAVSLSGNPTFNLLNGNGTAATTVTLGALNDGGVARTVTAIGGAGNVGVGPRLVFGTAASVFTPGTTLVINTGANAAVRLTTSNAFSNGTAADAVIQFGATGTGVLQLLNNSSTTFNNNLTFGDNNGTILTGRAAAGTAVTHTLGAISIGNATFTLNQFNANTNVAHSFTLGASTFTGNAVLVLNNANGSGVGTLTLGALDDGGVVRMISKVGNGTLRLNGTATSLIAGTTLTATTGIVQASNSNALGSATLILGDGTTSSRVLVDNTVNLASSSTITYEGGFSLLNNGLISGPATGTGTVSSTININAPVAAETGHFIGGGGTLNFFGPIVTGGTSGGEIIIRSGNIGLNNATGNTYTSLRVLAGTTTLGVTDAIPTGANVFLAETAATTLTLGSSNQTIASGSVWTLGGTGPTLENNVATINTGTGTLTLNGTLANNTGSLATQLLSGSVSFGGTSGTFDIDSGHATSDMTVSANLSNGTLIKEGAGILTLTGTKSLAGVTVNNGTLVGGYGTSGVNTVSIGATGSLQLVNNLAETLTLGATPSALNVAGGARIGFELGAPSISDQLVVGVGGTAATSGTITLDFYNLGALAAGTYTLLTADSGLMTGGTTYNVGSAPLGFNYQINATDTLVQLITTAYTPRFWTGSQATTSWNTINAGPLSNWATDSAGTVNSTDVPGPTHTVIFSATNATGPTISSTLDADFTIDALQFLAAPTGVTAVNIGAGTGGTLAIAPATSSAGIFVGSNAGTATLSAGLPLTVSAAQNWNVVGGGANGSALVVAADTAFNANLTKSGAGALTLSGTNSGTSNFTLSAGTLNINSATALGAGTFIISGGTTINNTSGGALTLTPNNALTFNGNFTFTGTQNLNLGAGAISLPTNVSITTAGGNLTLAGVITEAGGARSLTKLGAGALTLTGNNAFSGGVNLNVGILNFNNAGALGTGDLTITGGTLDNTSGAAITNANNNEQTWNGNFAFTGTNNLNLGTGAVSLGSAAGATRTVTVNAGTLTVAGGIANGAVGVALTKAGAGTLTLSGANTYTGNTVLQAGTLNITGSLTGNNTTSTITTGTVAGTTTLNISGDISMFNIQGGNLAGANSLWNQTAGTVTLTPGTGNNNYLATASGSYGFFNLTGGTYKNTGRFIAANAAGSSGVMRISGTGAFDHTNAEHLMVSQGGTGEITVLAGGSIDHTGSNNEIHVTLNQSNTFGLFNIAGGTVNAGTRGVEFGNSNTTVLTNNVGIVNLAAGTLSMGAGFVRNFGGTGTVADVYLNFGGGTLRANAAMATVIPTSQTSNPQVTINSTIFGAVDNSAVSGAPSFNGGLLFDTNNFTSVIGPVLAGAHTSNGVTQANISITGGSGYVGPPVVQFSTVGVVAGGTPASGYAIVSDGQVTGIVITAPGTYTAGSTPTVTLSGGGGTGASISISALNTANLGAGLTASGGGQLTLGGANTYNGVSTVTGAGTILASTVALGDIGSAGGFGLGDATSNATNAASLVIDGGAARTAVASQTATNRLFTLTQNGGALQSNNSTAANFIDWTNTAAIAYTGSGARTLTFGGQNTGANTFAPLITNAGGDAVTIGKDGTGTWVLTNALNSYTGGTNIGAGILGFNSGALGTTGNITFTGASTLRWNTGVTDDLSARLMLTNGVTGTVDTNGNDVTFATGVGTTGGTTGVLNKTGAGALTLNGAATHTGGVTLTTGTLNLGHAGALGTGTFTLATAGLIIDNTSGSALTLSTNPAQAWNNNFSFTGSNSLNMGTGAVTLSAARTVTVDASTLTVGGDIGGLFALTKSGPGTLYLASNSSTFGAAAGSNVTINGGVLRVDSEAGLGNALNDLVISNGAVLQVTNGFSADPGKTFNVNGAGGGVIQVDAGTLTINSALVGGSGGGLIKTGAGTLALTGASTGYDSISVGTGGATNVGFRVDEGTLLLTANHQNVVGDNNPNTMTVQLNGGNLSIRTDTASIARANLYVSAAATLTIDNANAGPGITQVIGGTGGQQLTMGTGSSTLNIIGGSNIDSGTAVAQFNNATFLTAPTFNLTNPTSATTQLTLGTVTAGANTATFTGNGNFVQSGIWGSAGGGITLGNTYSGLATLSQANTYTGVTTVNGGTLAFSASGHLGDASVTNTLSLGGGTLRSTATGAVDLTANRVITLSTGTTSTVDVSSITATLQVTGGFTTSGSANLVKTGTGNLAVSGPLDLSGGNLTVANGTYTGALHASGVGNLTVTNLGNLQLVDAAANTATLASALTINGGARLGFELGAPGTNDSIASTLAAVTSSGVITLDFFNLGGLAAGTYNLLSAPSGLLGSGVNYTLGNAPSGFNYVINQTDALISLTTSILSNRYWTGSELTTSWSTINAGPLSNFSTDLAGTINSTTVPTSADTVIFSATSVLASPVSTTLDAAFTIDSLVFNANPAGGTFDIAPGTGGSLNLSPVSTTNGISIGNNGGAVTLSAPLTTGTAQTWFVDGTGTSSLIVSGNTTFTGSVTKTGGGALTINGTNSGAGGFTLAAGTLNLGSSSALGTGAFTLGGSATLTATSGLTLTNSAHVWNGNFTLGGTQSLNLGAGPVTLASNVTAMTLSGRTLTVGGGIDDGVSTFGLIKADAGALVLNGNNDYDGLTLVSGGTLTLAGDNSGAAGGVTTASGTTLNINNANALGSGTFTIGGGTINNSTAAPIVNAGNNAQNWNASFTFTGNNDLNLGTGDVILNATPTITVNGSTLTVGGGINGGFGITKTGVGTLVLNGLSTTAASNYIGTTTLNNGTTEITTAAAFTGGLTFGSATTNTTPATLNLPSGATFAGTLLVQNNTATANTLTVGSGQTLTLNGNVTIGAGTPGAANATARLTIGGGGNLVVSTAAGGTFQVGGTTGGTSQASTLDLTGLATASINVSATGTVRVNQPTNSNVAGNQSTLLLPTPVVALNTPVTTITAANLNIGDNGGNGAGAGQVNTLTLGTGLTALNVNTINLGIGFRDFGQLNFTSGNGTLILRAADGVGRTAINIGTGTSNTGVSAGTGVTNNITLTGHSSDLLISTLTIGGQNRNTDRTDAFFFDTGTLDATAIIVGDNGGTASGSSNATWTSTLNIGGGTTIIGTGGLEIARGDTAVTGSDVIAGSVNISGGTVSIANSATLGAAVRLSHNVIAPGTDTLTTNGVLNITGGTVTVVGNIIRGSTAGLGSATLTLDGGSLDLSGNSIGSASPTVTFNAQSGTLANVAEINGGAGLTKTAGAGANTLILEGTNTYSGGTTISNGTLQIGGGTIGVGSATGNLGSGDVTNNATLTFNRSNSHTVANNLTGSGEVIQAGAGTTILSGSNTYTGKTFINAGILSIDSESRLGADPGAPTADQLTFNGGTLQTTATLAINDSNRGITVNVGGGTFETATGTTATVSSVILGEGAITKEGTGTLIFTAVNTNTGTTTINAGVLGGTGAVGGNLIVNAGTTLAPGISSEGLFTIGGNLNVASGGILLMQLGGSTLNAADAVRGNEGDLTAISAGIISSWESANTLNLHDRIFSNDSSAPVIAGTLKIDPAFLNGYTPVFGDVFDLLDWTNLSNPITGGTQFDFTGISLGDLAFSTDLFASNGILVVVPEPSRALLLMISLLGLAARRRRRVI